MGVKASCSCGICCTGVACWSARPEKMPGLLHDARAQLGRGGQQTQVVPVRDVWHMWVNCVVEPWARADTCLSCGQVRPSALWRSSRTSDA